ncbi:sodium-dependent nutrient amino acid transporter 1 [Culicoides brevitarsis]|uniref:sodium-dependent nutrient amino acid transporter 1 n=1 Tax=Culicoides brevitarsis TaxID=469753 RepID=UPI00307B1B3B
MKWKKKGQAPGPKQSITSTTSMSFLTDENLTFHRFSDGTISFDSMRKKSSMGIPPLEVTSYVDNVVPSSEKKPRLILREYSDASNYASLVRNHPNNDPKALTTPLNGGPVWTTQTSESLNSCYTNAAALTLTDESLSNDFTYMSGNNATVNSSTGMLGNGSSTMKLVNTTSMEYGGNGGTGEQDKDTKQTRCSIFRGVILCLCLNLTYANIVRLPRELHRDGFIFLVPYLTLLFFVGLPVVLLEMSLGQFLGQGSAFTWRASPFFKGAAITGRFAAWLATIFISMQSVLALLYIGWLSFKEMPFKECASVIQGDTGYQLQGISGQNCLHQTFLTPVWKNSMFFGFLALGLIFLWIITMLSTHSSKANRRMIFFLGFCTMVLLVFQTGWDVTRSINEQKFPQLWPFNHKLLAESTIWFNALVQVVFSLNIGVGALPVLTGKFLYKGDAVKTSFVYLCFNLLVTAISIVFYMMQFTNSKQEMPQLIYPELSTITTIYDRALDEKDALLSRLIPGLAYLMIFLSSLTTLVILIYTSSRMVRRHPNYTMCLAALVLAIIGLLCPEHVFPSILDARIVGSIIVGAMAFDIMSITWVYGFKNLYTDLEFSIGRPILKIWLLFWLIAPVILMGLLIWWAITYVSREPVVDFIPRWLPIVIALAFIVILACIEVSKQVDYNVFNMIVEATRPSKDWGPGDPLVRHSWKQWKSVCEDTGERDFTLRRRGTKDYTNSIKKGQYTHAGKYGTANRPNGIGKNSKASTPGTTGGSNSPNCSGSVFGDSAIEEDMSDRYPNGNYKMGNGTDHYGSTPRTSNNTSRKSSANNGQRKQFLEPKDTRLPYSNRRLSVEKVEPSYTSRIEITPPDPPIRARNPLARSESFQPTILPPPVPPPPAEFISSYGPNFQRNIYISSSGSTSTAQQPSTSATSIDNSTGTIERLNWRRQGPTKLRHDDEFSTEL